MKQIITVFTLLIIALAAPSMAGAQLFGGQSRPAATWTAKAEMRTKTEGVIVLTAKIESGWHIYGLDVPKEAPVATEISFVNTGIRLSGKITVNPEPEKKRDKVFGVDVTYWEGGTVTFTQPFKVTDAAKAHTQVKITFIGCSGMNCAAPVTETVNVDIPGHTRQDVQD